jgi:hypothetical protein
VGQTELARKAIGQRAVASNKRERFEKCWRFTYRDQEWDALIVAASFGLQ